MNKNTDIRTDPILILKGHEGAVTHVCWSPASDQYEPDRFLATSSIDNSVRVWDAKMPDGDATKHYAQQLFVLLGHTNYLRSVEWSPNFGLLVSCGDDCTARVWDMHGWFKNGLDPSREHALISADNAILCLGWKPDGNMLAIGMRDCSVRIFDMKRVYEIWQEASSLSLSPQLKSGHTQHVHSLAFHPYIDEIASGGADMSLKVWKLNGSGENETLATSANNIYRHQIWDVEWSHNGEMIATTGADGEVRIWNKNAMFNTGEFSLQVYAPTDPRSWAKEGNNRGSNGNHNNNGTGRFHDGADEKKYKSGRNGTGYGRSDQHIENNPDEEGDFFGEDDEYYDDSHEKYYNTESKKQRDTQSDDFEGQRHRSLRKGAAASLRHDR